MRKAVTKNRPKPKGRTWSMTLVVVGMQFRWKQDGRATLARAVPFKVTFERETDNPKDENAIKVMIASDFKLTALKGKQLGYVRRGTAEKLAPHFDAGTLELVKGWCTDINPDSGEAEVECRFRDLKKRGGKRV